MEIGCYPDTLKNELWIMKSENLKYIGCLSTNQNSFYEEINCRLQKNIHFITESKKFFSSRLCLPWPSFAPPSIGFFNIRRNLLSSLRSIFFSYQILELLITTIIYVLPNRACISLFLTLIYTLCLQIICNLMLY